LVDSDYRGPFVWVPAGRFLLNSTVVPAVTVVLGLIVNSMAAFALARMRWGGKKLVLGAITAECVMGRDHGLRLHDHLAGALAVRYVSARLHQQHHLQRRQSLTTGSRHRTLQTPREFSLEHHCLHRSLAP
jgi:hypothetical protein